MQEAMETNGESLFSTTGGLFFSQDSSLLSDYLQHHHAQKAGKRLIHPSTPLIISPSKRLFTAPTQREEAEASEPPCFSSFKDSSSSANSMLGPSFTTVKESSESLIARECSSQTLSELDYNKGDSDCVHRTTLSSFSCIESIECDESGTEASTKIHTSRASLNFSRLSCELKERNVLADDDGKVYASNRQPSDVLDHRSPTHNIASVNLRVFANSKLVPPLVDYSKNLMCSECDTFSNSMTGFDLLVNAAMQVEFLDNQDIPITKASIADAKKWYACPLQLNSPILKKRVIRRARNSFSKQAGEALLHRLGISSPARHSTKEPVAEKDDNCTDTSKATHMQQHRNAIQYVRRKRSKTLPAVTSFNSKNGPKQENLQGASADICKQKVKVVTIKEGRCNLKQQKNMHSLPTAELVRPALGTAVKLEFDPTYRNAASKERAVSVSETVNSGNNQTIPEASAETLACIKFGGSGIRVKFRPVNLSNKAQMEAHEFEAIEQDTMDSRITRRSENLPITKHAEISKCNIQLTKGMMSYYSDYQQIQADNGAWLSGSTIISSQESNKWDTPEHVPQGNLIRKKCQQYLIEEHKEKRSSDIKSIEVAQLDSSDSPGQSNPSIRTKRGRSQVLPSKFSDSVLQPWKRAYRKKS